MISYNVWVSHILGEKGCHSGLFHIIWQVSAFQLAVQFLSMGVWLALQWIPPPLGSEPSQLAHLTLSSPPADPFVYITQALQKKVHIRICSTACYFNLYPSQARYSI